MEEGGFTLVGKKGRPCKAYRKDAVNAKAARMMRTTNENGEAGGVVILPCDCECTDARIKSVNKRLTKAISMLRTNGYWDALKASLSASAAKAGQGNEFRELVSYGIGNFCCTRVSLVQFAVFLLLKEEFCGPETKVSAYDPAFGDVCKGVCELRGVPVAEKDERAAHSCAEATLFYMPHCDLFMYENVISANWIKKEKEKEEEGKEEGKEEDKEEEEEEEESECGYVDPRVTIVGNSLLSYIERFDSVAAKKNPHVASCEASLVEAPIVFVPSSDSNSMNAFNNTSVHRFINKSN